MPHGMMSSEVSTIAKSWSGYTIRNGLELVEKGALPVLQPKDFQSDEKALNPLGLNHYPESIKKHFLEKGDLLLANKGTKFATFLFDKDYPCIASASFFVIRVNSKKCYPEFLQWYLEQPEAKDYFLKNSVTTTIPSLSKAVLDKLQVPLPPLSVQARIIRGLELIKKEQRLLKDLILKTEEFRDTYIWELIASGEDC
jgi:restriction endonuclease S subunit